MIMIVIKDLINIVAFFFYLYSGFPLFIFLSFIFKNLFCVYSEIPQINCIRTKNTYCTEQKKREYRSLVRNFTTGRSFVHREIKNQKLFSMVFFNLVN